MAAAFQALRTFPKAQPFLFGAGFSCFKNGLADVVVQTQVEGAGLDDVDWRRVSIFSTFGLVFAGFWQYTLFAKIMPKLCPNAVSFAAKPLRAKLADKQGLKQLAIQIGLENGVNNPILYFPVFYALKNSIETRDYNPLVTIPRGIER